MSSAAAEPDVLAVWSERIAARVAPDEIELAPDVLTAYLTGGMARRQLFTGPRADPGAFGAGLPLVLPHVIDALVHCHSVVKGFLGDPAVNSTIAIASLVVALRQSRKAGSAQAEATAGTPAALPRTAELPVAEAEVVGRATVAVAALTIRLEAVPVTADRAEAVAGEVLTTLATDPSGALHFLAVLGKSAT